MDAEFNSGTKFSYVDSTGNPISYFDWDSGQPDNILTKKFLEVSNGGKWISRIGSQKTNIVCVKCPGNYNIPSDYECLETDFGTVIIKPGVASN